MSVNYTITGLTDVERRLRVALSGVESGTAEGLKVAGEIVKNASEDLTSIDTAELIESSFNIDVGGSGQPARLVGYAATYAAAVHEMPDNTNWQRPGAENKFLEKAVVRNFADILNTVLRFARIK